MISRDPAKERDAWRRDLETIRGLGFNSVKTWVDWATTEPERGKYRFEALDQMLALADQAGLKVILQLYADSAPEWLGHQYPDASFVTDQGARIGSQASPGYCLDHPGVRADSRRVHLRGVRSRRIAPVLLRRRSLERTAHRQLGVVQHAGRVLLLPGTRSAGSANG